MLFLFVYMNFSFANGPGRILPTALTPEARIRSLREKTLEYRQFVYFRKGHGDKTYSVFLVNDNAELSIIIIGNHRFVFTSFAKDRGSMLIMFQNDNSL